jgi:hypothetical protein
MKSRLAVLWTMVLLAGGLEIGAAQPAHAVAVSIFVVDGVITLANGVAYPCLSGKDGIPPNVPTVDVAKCTSKIENITPFALLGAGAGITAKAIKNKCDDLFANVVCTQVATYSFTTAGTVSGYCSFLQGSGAGTIAKAVNLVETKESSPPILVSYSLTSIADVLIITGSASRSGLGVGSFFGLSLAVLVPGGLLGTGTCLNKASKSFRLVGAFTILWPNP